MANITTYDCIVVGAGIMGCATALELVRKGYNTLLIDKDRFRFPLPHSRGSSHGQSRQYRYLYDEPTYIKLLGEALAGFKELEQLSGETLFVQTGSMMIGHKNDPYINGHYSAMRQCRLPFEKLETPELRKRLPHHFIDDDYIGLYDPEGGMLLNDKCLLAYRAEFKKLGGHLVDRNAVTELIMTKQDPTVTLITENGQIYSTTRVAVCLGPWARPLVKKWLDIDLPIKPLRATCYYAPVRLPGAYSALKGWPTINYVLPNHEFYFAWASYEYKDMIKIGLHSECKEIDPDERDTSDMEWHRQKVTSFFGKHWKEIAPVLALTEECIYTWSVDGHFIIDTSKNHPNICFASGFSGHGFKFAPVIGKIMADLVSAGKTKYDIELFSMKRFENCEQSQSKL